MVFTIGALWFLATKLNWQEFSEILRQAKPGWFAAALVAYGGVVLVSIVRWHLLLEVAGAAVGWGRTAQLAVAGLFFNSILPGVMGGDVMRAFGPPGTPLRPALPRWSPFCWSVCWD